MRASTKNDGCSTWRSPAPRTPYCCPVITGARPNPSRAARRRSSMSSRTSSTQAAAAGDAVRGHRAVGAAPADGEPNPLRDNVVEAVWPDRPGRRAPRPHGPGRRAGRRRRCRGRADDDLATWTTGWAADVDALLAERETRGRTGPAPSLPAQLSVSTLVELGRDPEACAQRLQRRLPSRPDPHALLGTAFHDWVQRFFHAERLFDLDDLPGAVDREPALEADDLAELQAAFAVSPWAARTPSMWRCPFDMVIGGRWCAAGSTRCSPTTTAGSRWWTGRPAIRRDTPEALQHDGHSARASTGWPGRRLQGCALESVRAAFHYVRSGRTVAPDALLGRDELARAARRRCRLRACDRS